MTLALAFEACVRSRSLAADCHACVDACPASAISLDGPRASVKVDLSACTACGQCQPACPVGAFSGVFDAEAFLAQAGPALACGPTFCLGALAAEDFVTLALRHATVSVDGTGCTRCHALRARLSARVEEASTFLTAAGYEARLHLVVKPGAPPPQPPPKPAPVPSRRALLRGLVPGLVKEAVQAPTGVLALEPVGTARLDPVKLRAKAPPTRRARLEAQLATATRTRASARVEAERIGFASSKVLDLSTCTGCLQCVSACPSGALTTSRARDELRFEAAACVKCHACHDVCEPGALTLAPRLETAQVLSREPVVLGRFTVKDCAECGARFKYDGGEVLCAQCRGLDDEARSLHGLPPRPGGQT
jgi:ferredoxin